MSGYVRDQNGALLNTDDNHYRALLAERETRKRERKVTEQLQSLESDLIDIKKQIQELLGRNN